MTVDRTNLAVWQLEGCHEGKIWADMPASFRLYKRVSCVSGFFLWQTCGCITLSSLFKKKHPRSEMIWVRWFVEKPCGLWVFTLTAETSSWRDEALTRCWVNFVQKKLQDTRKCLWLKIVEGMAEIVRMGKCHMSGLDFGWFGMLTK